MILFIAITLGVFGYEIFKAYKIVKYPMPKTLNYPNEIKNFVYLNAAVSVSSVLIFVFLAMYQLYPMKAGDWAQLIFGALIFGFTLPTFVLSFIIHYYGKEIDTKSDKILYVSMISSGFVFFIGLILLTNGLADYITYPMVNGLSFTKGFVNPASGDKPNLAWYAICILSGALLVYFICDHRFYKEYGKHGILESTFFVAFPAGVVGARIGYVIGEWQHGGFAERVARGEWWSIFAVWEGGLTVISGALVGIVVGIAWFLWRNKKYSIWLAVDVIVPCILVAQAVGRWGNYFNCEVHGNLVNASDWWFLPKIILNNAQYSESAHWANGSFMISPTQIYAPLFYVEFLANLTGYALLRFAIGKGLRKYIELGDLAAGYIIWYGFTRVVMEPMRYTAYNMGNDGYWSWMWSIIFVLAGSFFILMNHLVRFFIRRKKGQMISKVNVPVSIGVTSVLCLGGLALLILGTVFMSTSVQSNFLGFNRYNNGFILLVTGLGTLFISICALLYLSQGLSKHHEK